MTLGERLKIIRGTRTQTEFSTELGLSKNTYVRYERGQRIPDTAFLETVIKKFHINPVWILTGNGWMGIKTEEFMDQQLEIGREVFCTKLRMLNMFLSSPVFAIVDSLELSAKAAKEGTLKPYPPDMLKFLLHIKSFLDRIVAAIDDIVSRTKLE